MDDFLAPTMGRISMQEDIMKFLVKFCGYNDAESDNVRRAIAKKKGTDKLLPEIEERFVNYTHEHFGVSIDKCKEVAPSMIQVIKDASDYGFSWNHSDAYSCIGYICGYLRYYYPLEFITVALNIFHDKEEKTNAIVKYANKIGVKIENIKFGKSTEKYALDKENNTIYKGLESIKFISAQSARELYDLRSINFSTFTDLLVVLTENTKVDTRQIRVLITLNFFSEFGKNGKLLDVFIKFCDRYKKTYVEKTKIQRIEEIKSYELSCNNYDISLADQIECELEFLGYISVKFNCSERWFYIVDVDSRYTPKLTLYCLKDGNVVNYKMDKKKFKKTMVKPKSVIFIKSFTIKPDWKKDGDNFIKTGSYSKVITDYVIVDTQKFDELNKKHGSKG